MKRFKDKSIRYQIKNRLIKIIVVPTLLLISACQTVRGPKVQEAPTTPSYWVFKTNVYSAKKNKNISGYTHITYMNPKLLRVDVYDPLGLINAGTLVYKDGSFEAVMPLEKKYFYGIATAETMFQILKSPIEPELFMNIIFQLPLKARNWECTTDAEGFTRECQNRSDGIDIVWKNNMSSADGWAQLNHSEGSVDLKLRSTREIKPLAAEKFRLKIPNSYSKFKVDASGIQKL